MLAYLLLALLFGYVVGVLACRSHYQAQYRERYKHLQQIIDALTEELRNRTQ